MVTSRTTIEISVRLVTVVWGREVCIWGESEFWGPQWREEDSERKPDVFSGSGKGLAEPSLLHIGGITMTKGNLRDERAYSTSISGVWIHWGKLRQDCGAGTEVEPLRSACSAWFLIPPRTTFPETTRPTMGWALSNFHWWIRKCRTGQSTGDIFSVKLPLSPNDSSFQQVGQKLTRQVMIRSIHH